MNEARRRTIIPADVHAARIDEMERIIGAIKDDVTEWIGTESQMSQVVIADRAGKGSGSRTVFAVWFLPGRTQDGHDTLINHGLEFALEFIGRATLRIKTWGAGYTAEARFNFPEGVTVTQAEMATFWEQVDDTARAIMHPAFEKEGS